MGFLKKVLTSTVVMSILLGAVGPALAENQESGPVKSVSLSAAVGSAIKANFANGIVTISGIATEADKGKAIQLETDGGYLHVELAYHVSNDTVYYVSNDTDFYQVDADAVLVVQEEDENNILLLGTYGITNDVKVIKNVPANTSIGDVEVISNTYEVSVDTGLVSNALRAALSAVNNTANVSDNFLDAAQESIAEEISKYFVDNDTAIADARVLLGLTADAPVALQVQPFMAFAVKSALSGAMAATTASAITSLTLDVSPKFLLLAHPEEDSGKTAQLAELNIYTVSEDVTITLDLGETLAAFQPNRATLKHHNSGVETKDVTRSGNLISWSQNKFSEVVLTRVSGGDNTDDDSGSGGGSSGSGGGSGGSGGGSGTTDVTRKYTDVVPGSWYISALQWAVDKGITNGISANAFGPDRECTRAEVVTFLWRAAGSPALTATKSFSDVAANSYYEKAVQWAVANGITNGTGDDLFSPNAIVDRAQVVTFLQRFAKGKTANTAKSFSDVPSDTFYTDAVQWAVEQGITKGTGDGSVFSPLKGCTRAEIVTFLYRYFVK